MKIDAVIKSILETFLTLYILSTIFFELYFWCEYFQTEKIFFKFITIDLIYSLLKGLVWPIFIFIW